VLIDRIVERRLPAGEEPERPVPEAVLDQGPRDRSGVPGEAPDAPGALELQVRRGIEAKEPAGVVAVLVRVPVPLVADLPAERDGSEVELALASDPPERVVEDAVELEVLVGARQLEGAPVRVA
jgi:hypothetical protein